MSLRVVVAAPFKQAGGERMRENEFVVALSLDRDWMSPDQAKRVLDLAMGEGLLDRDGEALVAAFDPGAVTVPDGFSPDPELFRERSAFEQVLDALEAVGVEKQTAVADINQVQAELAVSVEAAAVVYARRRGVDAASAAETARATLQDGNS
ncbi:MAG: DUF2240 family protein [Halobacteriaceae archaeon]